MKIFVAFISGLLFAGGLVIGGMTQPAKIVNFLDFAGNWDPSLAFVMGGALLVYAVTFRWVQGRSKPVFEGEFHIPTRNDIDWQLIVGGILFGIGWGVSGFCPGPAITAAASFSQAALAVTGGIIGGMVLYRVFDTVVLS